MFCKYCGKEIESGREMCDTCAGNETKSEVLFKGEEVVKETPSFGGAGFNNDFSSNNLNYNLFYNLQIDLIYQNIFWHLPFFDTHN